jgi:hypothetical protein
MLDSDRIEKYSIRRYTNPLPPLDSDVGDWLYLGPNTPPKAVVNPPSSPKSARWRAPDLIRGSEVRKVRARGKVGYTADNPMTRLQGKVVSAANLLQADFVLVTDAQDPDIVRVVSKPMALETTVEGRKREWVPDYLIERRAGPRELVDVMLLTRVYPADGEVRRSVHCQLEARQIAARVEGFRYRLVTEQEIRIEPMLYNARLMHRHNGPFRDPALLLKAILAVARLGPSSSVAKLGEAIGKPRAAMELAIRLDRLGHLRLDRSGRFDKNTRFELFGEMPTDTGI